MKTKLLASTAFALGALLTTASVYADTLNFHITDASTMTASWYANGYGDLGTMKLEKRSNGVFCGSAGGIECADFGLAAMLYADWNTVYNQTVNWKMYGFVKRAGGSKTYTLTSQRKSATFSATRAIKAKSGGYQMLMLQPK